MRNIWTIAKREYKLYFNGPIAYAVALLLFFIQGIAFYQLLRDMLIGMVMQQTTAPTVQMITGGIIVFVLVFTTPAVTMRLLAEEQRTGTMELLLTAPVRDWELVFGKWLGGVLFMLTLLLATLIYPLILNHLVSPGIDQGLMIAGYVGLTLLVMSLVAVGVAVSSLFSNQIAAFFTNLLILLALWLAQAASSATGSTTAEIIKSINFIQHYVNFVDGVIDIRDVVYYLSIVALGLFLGTTAIEIRRWR